MKRLLLTLGFLAAFGTAQAEYLESNVTLQMKLYSTKEVPPSGGYTFYDHTVTSFKTFDFIKLVAQQQAQPAYTSKARLIFRILQTDNDYEVEFLIREKGRNDYTLEDNTLKLESAPHIRVGAEARVEKGKKDSADVGTVKYILFTDTTIKPNGTDALLKITGQALQNIRSIASKQYPDKILNCSTINMSGAGSYDINPESLNIRNGYAQGSVKFTAPKIIENP